jgi:hypothetical protein
MQPRPCLLLACRLTSRPFTWPSTCTSSPVWTSSPCRSITQRSPRSSESPFIGGYRTCRVGRPTCPPACGVAGGRGRAGCGAAPARGAAPMHPCRCGCARIAGPIDIVDVFRRGSDVPGHVEDILACKPLPRAVWLQVCAPAWGLVGWSGGRVVGWSGGGVVGWHTCMARGSVPQEGKVAGVLVADQHRLQAVAHGQARQAPRTWSVPPLPSHRRVASATRKPSSA